MKSKFKKGDLVTEIEPNYFTKGSVLKLVEDEAWDCLGFRLVSGDYHDSGIIYIYSYKLTHHEEKDMNVPEHFPWAKGDKATITSISGTSHKVTLTENPGQIFCSIDKEGGLFIFHKDCNIADSLQPRGKKTKAKYAQWEKSLAEQEKSQYEVGDWVEFIAEDGANSSCHKTGDKFQIAKMSPSGQCIRSEKWDSWTDVENVKPCEAPDPWEGIEWAKISGRYQYRSVKLLNRCYGDDWKGDSWIPVKLDDLTKEELIALINWNKHLMGRK